MTITILANSFSASGLNPHGDEAGHVGVQIDGVSHTLRAVRYGDGRIAVAGFVGRYRTSAKPWQAFVTREPDGRTSAYFGRDDRQGRFNKERGISFEPATFAAVANADYWRAAGE